MKAASLQASFLKKNLDFKVQLNLEEGRKAAAVNGKRVNSATLMAHFPTVLFSPESLSAIKEGPEQRRLLIDEILLSHSPTQARLIREYSKALRSRNRLLKSLSEQTGPVRELRATLESIDKIYFLLATHLTVARMQALKDIEPSVREAMRFILDEPAGEIAVEYLISGESAIDWNEVRVYDAMLKRHAELAEREISSGASLVGPHKHDIKLLFSGNDSRFYCSQGQQRALILALKIAQIVYHHRVHQTYPVLLLDDVLSELDFKKRVNLMKFLEGISAQILITATDLTWSDRFRVDRNSVFAVSHGQVDRSELSSTAF